MTDNDAQSELDESRRDASEELGEMEGQADEMEDRLVENEAAGEEVEVPEPDQGEDLSISE